MDDRTREERGLEVHNYYNLFYSYFLYLFIPFVFLFCVQLTECAPLLANLYLFYYEYIYMKNLMKLDYGKSVRFYFIVRYVY